MPLKNLEPLQMIVFPYKEEVESSYLTLNSNYNWDLKKRKTAIYLLFEVAFAWEIIKSFQKPSTMHSTN